MSVSYWIAPASDPTDRYAAGGVLGAVGAQPVVRAHAIGWMAIR